MWRFRARAERAAARDRARARARRRVSGGQVRAHPPPAARRRSCVPQATAPDPTRAWRPRVWRKCAARRAAPRCSAFPSPPLASQRPPPPPSHARSAPYLCATSSTRGVCKVLTLVVRSRSSAAVTAPRQLALSTSRAPPAPPPPHSFPALQRTDPPARRTGAHSHRELAMARLQIARACGAVRVRGSVVPDHLTPVPRPLPSLVASSAPACYLPARLRRRQRRRQRRCARFPLRSNATLAEGSALACVGRRWRGW